MLTIVASVAVSKCFKINMSPLETLLDSGHSKFQSYSPDAMVCDPKTRHPSRLSRDAMKPTINILVGGLVAIFYFPIYWE